MKLVRALARGFFQGIRNEGEEFMIPDEHPVGGWLESVGPKAAPEEGAPAAPTAAKPKRKKKHW